jgi:hypothetical protein
MTVPLRAVLYLRVSTARQAEHDVSILDQKRQGEAYCASRGYHLVETYVEPGASATNDRRPEFQRMIEAGTSKPAPFDVVIVHSFKARQDETGCVGQSIPMEKLDSIVGGYIEDRLLAPERLEEVLASVLDRRQEHSDRRREHIAELNKRAAETELRLKRFYDAIESGVADLDDPALRDRITSLKALRDQAQADAERAQAMLESTGQQTVTPQALRQFAQTARKRMRLDSGGYRRDHLRLLAHRVEVADKEVRIMGSKGTLLRTLAAISGVATATPGVPRSVLKWRRG